MGENPAARYNAAQVYNALCDVIEGSRDVFTDHNKANATRMRDYLEEN